MAPLEFVLQEIEECKAKMVGHDFNKNGYGVAVERARLDNLYEVVKIVESST